MIPFPALAQGRKTTYKKKNFCRLSKREREQEVRFPPRAVRSAASFFNYIKKIRSRMKRERELNLLFL